MDIIYIRELRIQTVIGILEWERQIKQPVLLDMEIKIDNRLAAKTGQLSDTVDYSAIAVYVTDYLEQGQFTLLEVLAEQLIEKLLAEFKLEWIRLRIAKPGAVANAKEVGLVIERGQH